MKRRSRAPTSSSSPLGPPIASIQSDDDVTLTHFDDLLRFVKRDQRARRRAGRRTRAMGVHRAFGNAHLEGFDACLELRIPLQVLTCGSCSAVEPDRAHAAALAVQDRRARLADRAHVGHTTRTLPDEESSTASEIARLLSEFGGRHEARTRDLRVANAALSQLS